MASNRTSGNLLGLQIDREFIACEMSCDFNFDAELLDASPETEGRWKEYIQGVRSWSISLNAGLLMRMVGTGLPNVLNAFMTGSTMAIAFRTKLNDYVPNLIISGNVFVQNGGISSSVNTLATWTVNLTGNGAFSIGINTNILYAIGTGIDYEALQDGQNNLLAGDSGGVDIQSNGVVSNPVEGGNTSGSTNGFPLKVVNAGEGTPNLQFGTFDSENFTTDGKPDDFISIVTE